MDLTADDFLKMPLPLVLSLTQMKKKTMTNGHKRYLVYLSVNEALAAKSKGHMVPNSFSLLNVHITMQCV